jgi:hypothetical protein
MKRFLPFLAAFTLMCCANDVYATPKITKTKKYLQRVKKNIYDEFSQTHLRSRIVEVNIKNVKNEPIVQIMWHPFKTQDITKDTFVIVQIIDKFVPNFASITLKAINPERMRWTKQIFWNETIKRENLILVIPEGSESGAVSINPLFYQT